MSKEWWSVWKRDSSGEPIPNQKRNGLWFLGRNDKTKPAIIQSNLVQNCVFSSVRPPRKPS